MRLNQDISKDMSVASTEYNREGEYWLNQLSGEWVNGRFPYDHNDHQTGRIAGYSSPVSVGFGLPEGLFSQLVKLSKGNDYTMHMIFLALLVVLVYKYTGSSDILVGIPIYKQDSDEILSIRCCP